MDANPDRVNRIRRTRSEVENHVIDELFAGRITRRDFVRRMTVLGMSASFAGFLAACSNDNGGGGSSPSATGASGATGAVVPGGTLKTGIIAPASGLDPLAVNDEGGLAVLGQSGEYLAWSNDQLELEPRIAESWTPNGDGTVWTFAIRQGVTFQDGTPLTAADVVATMELHTRPEEQVERALRIRGCALARRGEGDRRRNGRVHARCGERELPVPGQLRQLQRDHPAQDVLRRLGQDVHRDRSLEDADVHARRRRHLRQEPRLLGPDPPAERRHEPDHVLQGGPGEGPWAPGRRGEHPQPVLRGLGTSAVERPEHHGHLGTGIATSPGAHALRPGPVQGQAHPPGGRAHVGQTLDHPGPPGRQSRPRQRQSVRAGLPLDRHVGAAARAGRGASDAVAVRRGPGRGLRCHAVHVGQLRDPRPGAGDPAGAEAGRDQREAAA